MLRLKISAPKCALYRSIIPMRCWSQISTTIHSMRLNNNNNGLHNLIPISKFHINEMLQARKAKTKTRMSQQSSTLSTEDEEDGIPILKQQILQLMMNKKSQKEKPTEEFVEQTQTTLVHQDEANPTEQESKPKRSIKTKPHVVLIDASSLIYKSHYAHSTLQNGALFGYVRYLLRLVTELKPFKNIVVVFDGPRADNFRTEIYADYKINRKDTPADLKAQRDLFPEATEACNIPHLCLAGVEGDDVIASLAKQAIDSGHRVTIVSPDKDFFQLVSDDIEIYDVDKKLFKGIKEIQEKIGVHPDMAAQFQALVGDDVDNIPGVPGIGDKTAASLLNKYKSLEKIFENLDEICTSVKLKKLKDNVDLVKRNMDLVVLKDDLKVPNIEEFQSQAVDKEKLVAFLEKNNMKSILQKLETESMEDYDPTRPAKEVSVDVEEDEAIQPKEPSDPNSLIPEGVTVVRDRETAERIQKQLRTMTDRYHACDTEAIDVDINRSPVGQGKIICFSIFCGPDVDFGQGSRIWVDTMEDEGILQIFKDYFEDPNIKKVWHNYSFDTHVLATSGIVTRGFGGDTMQMARLWDSSRVFKGGYSLQGLTENLALPIDAKKTIKERFGKIIFKKDGTPSKKVDSPELDQIQRDAETIQEWIEYSTLDSEATWYVREELERLLKNKPWKGELNMWHFYCQEWLPFGELLVEIERAGIKVNVAHLKEVEEIAKVEYLEHKKTFLEWATKYCPDAVYMNINSDAQKQQLLFGNQPKKEKSFFEEKKLPDERKFETENTELEILPGKTKAKKKKSFLIKGLGIPPVEITTSGLPAVNNKVIRTLAGSNPREGKFGTAYKFFGGDEEGKAACIALDSLHESGSIQTLLSTFIIPLQELVDENGRIHTSLNVNTETGRLSSRKPNLQNQPALEKDRYKIRDAFTCEPGNMLIVADYGQLELRLLAHTTKCKSMIEAFEQGGDFHSRTAIGMYPEIKEAVEKGEVLLEWDFSKGPPPVPLLKDKFASQRKHAKTLNFSIAYGKTSVGLAKDWGVDVNEATNIVDLWYKDRPEVRQWQNETIEKARMTEETRTLLGRYRRLPYNSNHKGMKGHYDRAAINTPLQGGAADVVACAMVKLRNCKRLRDLGWQQVLQIHDEIILEGPEESTKEALQLVTEIMQNPLDEPLLVNLDISVQAAKTWYGAK